MQPKRQETETQYDLFKIALADLLNPCNEQFMLANQIDWVALDKAFGEFFVDNKGANNPVDCGTTLPETRLRPFRRGSRCAMGRKSLLAVPVR